MNPYRSPYRGVARGDCSGWFLEWLDYHQLLHHSRLWVKADHPDASVVFGGWMEAFDRWGITHEDARRVSRLLQESEPPRGGPKAQLQWIRARWLDMRRGDRASAESGVATSPARSAGEMLAAERSEGCPECSDADGPTGWARRRMVVDGFPWSLFVDLYCRCPLGRHRERTAPDRDGGQGRAHSDLQLLTELWDGRLAHHSWDWSDPAEVSCHEPGDGWRYLTPREAEAYRQPDLVALKAMCAALVRTPPARPMSAWPPGDPILAAELERRGAPP